MEVLFIPWILVLLALIAFISIVKSWKKYYALALIILLLVNWRWHVFALNFPEFDNKQKDFRILSWNVSCTDTISVCEIEELKSEILKQTPDVVFLTEYYQNSNPLLDSLLSLHYPYQSNINVNAPLNMFYCRTPIQSELLFTNGDNGSLFRYELTIKSKTVKFYCVHMQSNNLLNGVSFYPDSIADRGGIMRYLDNYKVASEIRREQAKLIVRDMTDAPSIVMGDMNDVYGSPCMKVFEDAGLRDAWWNVSFGYGATIHNPLPYRIDHVMYGNGLRLKGIKKVSSKGLSDHDALVADFEL